MSENILYLNKFNNMNNDIANKNNDILYEVWYSWDKKYYENSF